MLGRKHWLVIGGEVCVDLTIADKVQKIGI